MEVIISEFGEIGTKIVLVGKLDIAGADKIDMPLSAVAGSRSNIVVDMAGVDFIASIGIRHLVMAAKAVARGAGKLVLLDPNPLVTEVLITSGLEDLLPIVRTEDEARAVLARAASG
jgi:stage II sporulation protein AA (anti-sigma F factor antagonist)